MKRPALTSLALFLLLGGLFSAIESKAAGLKVGDTLTPFTAIDQDGHLWKSEDIIGKKNLIVYFYPAAMTGGCTKQACAFRDDADKLKALNAVVVGVSGDVPAGLKAFQKTHDLNFSLLADYDGKIAKIFGVPMRDGGEIKRAFEGKEIILKRGVTSARWTYVVGLDGKVGYMNSKVNAAKDSENVQAFLKK